MQEIKSSSLFLKLAGCLLTMAAVVLLAGAVFSEDYDRDYHFKHWSDLDNDGLNTREELVIEQSILGEGKLWVCPYTGEVYVSPKTMDLDHIVPLEAAWNCGADKWTPAKREQFANDPENLLLVSSSANRSKGAQRPDQWLPMNLSFVDDYIYKTLHIYQKYDLMCPDLDPLGLAAEIQTMKGVKPWQLQLK